ANPEVRRRTPARRDRPETPTGEPDRPRAADAVYRRPRPDHPDAGRRDGATPGRRGVQIEAGSSGFPGREAGPQGPGAGGPGAQLSELPGPKRGQRSGQGAGFLLLLPPGGRDAAEQLRPALPAGTIDPAAVAGVGPGRGGAKRLVVEERSLR